MTIKFKPVEFIIRERQPDASGQEMGWLVLAAGPNREREVVAILTRHVGLEVARELVRLLAAKYEVLRVKEEAPQQVS
ncbi:MAG TPA: hypothetical protein VH186_22360 [Chloroflexia bacterium]|nr:hypothetical protein [Chloroflexia bacterium]